jgi:magnesium-transporting ATPase (P-type)
MFLLPVSFGQALTIIAAVLIGITLPITAVQILWVNMITAVTLGLALAFEPGEPDLMDRKPRPPDAPLLSGFLVWRILFVSLLLVAGAFGLFMLERAAGAPIEVARTVAVNAVVAGEIVYLINARYITNSSLSLRGLFGSRIVLVTIALVIVFQALFTYLPLLNALFGTAALTLDHWLRIAGFAVALFLAVEIEKAIVRGISR